MNAKIAKIQIGVKMNCGDLVYYCKKQLTGVILTLKDGYAEVIWTKAGMYRPELINIKELELVNG